MAIDIEQLTAPGKYEYNLAIERIEAELKNPTPLYNGKFQKKYKSNPDYVHKDSRKK